MQQKFAASTNIRIGLKRPCASINGNVSECLETEGPNTNVKLQLQDITETVKFHLREGRLPQQNGHA